MVKTVKIQDEYWDLIVDTADQLDTSIKEVVEGIMEYFFTELAKTIEDVDEEEDDDDEDDDEEE